MYQEPPLGHEVDRRARVARAEDELAAPKAPRPADPAQALALLGPQLEHLGYRGEDGGHPAAEALFLSVRHAPMISAVVVRLVVYR